MTFRHLTLFVFAAPVLVAAQGVGRLGPTGAAPESWRKSPDVPPILIRAIREQRQGHYLGRRTVEFRVGRKTSESLPGPANLKHEEIVYRDGPRTRIEFPGGSRYSGQIIVESATERRHYMPDRNVILLLPPLREENYDRLVGLARRAADHRITLTGEPGERIAGLYTDQLVAHEQSGAVIQRLFIDPRSGVVLKRQVFDGKGQQIGYFQFTQMNLNPGVFDGTLFRLDRVGARVITPVDTLREIASSERFDPILIPVLTGYRLEESRIANVQNQKVLVETYGSRKGRLTLFELKSVVSPDRLKEFARGDFQVFTWQRGNKSFVLVGPRTQDELGQLAQSTSTGTP